MTDDSGSVLGPDPVQTARDLQAALEGMTAQLAAVKATVRRGKRVIITLVVSLLLDLAITVGLGWNTIRVNSAQDATRAIQVATHASQISACEAANVNRAQDAAVLDRLLADLAPPPVRTPPVQAKLAVLNRLIRAKDMPHDCAAVYRLP